MIFVTGDTHGRIDLGSLSTKKFPEQKMLSKSDYVIICGDFGCLWCGDSEDSYLLSWLSEKNFTTLWVDGNHENFDLLSKYPVTEWCGGKIQKITDSVFHLMRGQLYNIDDNRIFTMGGASSIDRAYRTEGRSWWKDELPSRTEYEEAIKTLDSANWDVDYIISHCCATSTARCFRSDIEGDELTEFFETLEEKCKFKHWYFGHHHDDKTIYTGHTLLYKKVIPLGTSIQK